MKKQTYTMIALFVLMGSMAVAAKAQTGGPTRLVANIPFEFSVSNKTLPAGEYTIQQVNQATDQVVLQLRSRDGRASAMVRMNSVIGRAQDTSKLIFNSYGSRYFFAQAWVDGDNSGLQAPKSRAERGLERELAGNGHKTEAIALSRQ